MKGKLLKVKNLATYFFTDEGVAKAVDGLSFELSQGEILGIVGESGSGKSVTALSLMRLLPQPPAKIVSGEILFKGKNILKMKEKDLRKLWGKEIAMIFQDPFSALNPVFTIGNQVRESVQLHQKISRKEALKESIKLLERVGISEAKKQMRRYPHELSGGMCQRAMIAIALSGNPSLLIADEPTTALDATIEAQILDLILSLKKERELGVILITHNLVVVAGIADKVLVLYAGKAVEYSEVTEIFYRPQHPYTQGLLNSIIALRSLRKGLKSIKGSPPNLMDLPPGCDFSNRCEYAWKICFQQKPTLKEVSLGHFVACHRSERRKELKERKRKQEKLGVESG